METILLTIFISIFTLIIWATQTNKDIEFAIIQGFMLGALYDVEEVDDEKWHTIQILLGVLSINIKWESEIM